MGNIYQEIGVTEQLYQSDPCRTAKIIAEYFGWKFVHVYTNPAVVIFRNRETRFNFYYDIKKVKTDMNHPKRGKTELFRTNVDLITLINLFLNPRAHTGKGFYKRASI